MDRPSWHTTWMGVAGIMAERATCPRLHVGAVAVTPDNQVLASGYNGAPRGLPHCADVGCELEGDHCIRAVHAESNTILQAARLGISLQGATLYTTVFPCPRCALQIIQAGIRRVYYSSIYRTAETDRQVICMFIGAGVGIFDRWGGA